MYVGFIRWGVLQIQLQKRIWENICNSKCTKWEGVCAKSHKYQLHHMGITCFLDLISSNNRECPNVRTSTNPSQNKSLN